MVVTAAPVSSTNRPGSVPRGPVTSTETMIRSPLVTKGVASLVIEDDGRSKEGPHGKVAGEVAADELVVIPPGARLVERFAFRLAVADDACRSNVEDTRMVVIDVDHADPFVGVPLADLGPGQWLRDCWFELFGSIHVSILDVWALLSSFWQPASKIDGTDHAISTVPPVSIRLDLVRRW